MDKEHRDELRENDLREFFRNFGAWFNKYGTPVLLGAAIVVLAFVGARWFTTKDQRMRNNGWAQLAASAAPESMAQVATEYPALPGLGAYALLEAADLLRREAMLGVGPDADAPAAPAELTEPQRQDLQQAADYYQRVLSMPDAPLKFKLNAHLGLAVTHVSLGDPDAAREHFRQARDNAGPFQNIAVLAKNRLQALDELPLSIPLPKKPAVPEATDEPTDQTDPSPQSPQPDDAAPIDAPTDADAGGNADADAETQPDTETQPGGETQSPTP